jgi:nucleotide-binding universal stress UspA family protein
MNDLACIVVGYDGSPTAQSALDWALATAGDTTNVVAVHAFEPPHDWLGHPYYERMLEEHRQRGQALLDALPDDQRIESDLIAGAPAEAIAGAASARNADLIVCGTRGFGPAKSVLGSVSHALLHLSDRPVVVIPG